MEKILFSNQTKLCHKITQCAKFKLWVAINHLMKETNASNFHVPLMILNLEMRSIPAYIRWPSAENTFNKHIIMIIKILTKHKRATHTVSHSIGMWKQNETYWEAERLTAEWPTASSTWNLCYRRCAAIAPLSRHYDFRWIVVKRLSSNQFY